MPRQLISLSMLALLAAAMGSPILVGASGPVDHGTTVEHHAEGAPCPDGDGDGPCEQTCPCLCCPGHTTAVVPFATGAADVVSPSAHSLASWPSDDDAPEGFCCRVFRPPRS